MKRVFLFLVFFVLSISSIVLAQEPTHHIEKVELSISGTSTLHDWKVSAEEVVEYPSQLSLTAEGGEISDFSFKVAVSSMDGGRGAAMNQKIMKALQADQHPYVSFDLTTPSVVDLTTDTFYAEGDISMAGSTKPFSIKVMTTQDAETVSFVSQQALLLSDFGIDPPSAMFGQIQTQDEVIVHFTFVYNKL